MIASFSSVPRSPMAQRSSRSRRTSSTRSTHSATRACLSWVGGPGGAPPDSWLETSTEITTSSTMMGMGPSGLLVHGEALVEQLHRLDDEPVVAGVQVGHGPPRGVRPGQAPGHQRLVVLIEQLDDHGPRGDLVVLDA